MFKRQPSTDRPTNGTVAQDGLAEQEAERNRLRAAVAEIDARMDRLERAPTRNHPFEAAGRAEIRERRLEVATIGAERARLVAQLDAMEESRLEAARAALCEQFGPELAALEARFRENGARIEEWMRAGAELFASRARDLHEHGGLSQRIRRAKGRYRIAPNEPPTTGNHPDRLADLPDSIAAVGRILERTLKDTAQLRAPRPDRSAYKRTPYPSATTVKGADGLYAVIAGFGPGAARR